MAEQIVLPFKLRRNKRAVNAQRSLDDLIGLSYYDGVSNVVVTGGCPSNPTMVVVERELDGKSWSVPGSLIRLIIGHEQTLRRTA